MKDLALLVLIIEVIIIMGCDCMATVKKGGVSLNSQIIQQRGKIAAVDDQIQALKQTKASLQGELAGLRNQKSKGGK